MKKLFKAFFMCLSMFTRIPPLYNKWDEEAKDYIILFLPIIGLIIGSIHYLIYYLLTLVNLPYLVNALILFIYPFLITGFIHLDGFMDTVDGISSYKPLDERIRILKDSHVGSFSVISVVLLLLSNFVLYSSLNIDTNYLFLFFTPVTSRILSSLSITIFKPLTVSEYNKVEEKNRLKIFKIIFFITLLVIDLVLCYIFSGLYVFVQVFLIILYLLTILLSVKSFKGINGDMCGHALTISESLSLILIIVFEVLRWI